MQVSPPRVKIDRRTEVLKAVQRALEQADVSSTSVEALEKATGATADEIRDVLEQNADAFRPEKRRAVERLLAQEVTGKRSMGPVSGSQPHVIRAQKHEPWFKAVKDAPDLGPVIHDEPARDIEVLGEKITREDLRQMLKRVFAS